MEFVLDIVDDFGASNGLKLVLLMGLMFATFVIWRLSSIVKALNKVEDTARAEIRDTIKMSSESRGQIDIIKKVVFK
tara:strand:+ start:74 stop:304 length:231 start_codon:yes stop_codon:yes gene_type:complete